MNELLIHMEHAFFVIKCFMYLHKIHCIYIKNINYSLSNFLFTKYHSNSLTYITLYITFFMK